MSSLLRTYFSPLKSFAMKNWSFLLAMLFSSILLFNGCSADDDAFTCSLNCLQNQITFTYQQNRWIVAYNYGSNNEQFSGTKQ
jgi:hypothetical protein